MKQWMIPAVAHCKDGCHRCPDRLSIRAFLYVDNFIHNNQKIYYHQISD